MSHEHPSRKDAIWTVGHYARHYPYLFGDEARASQVLKVVRELYPDHNTDAPTSINLDMEHFWRIQAALEKVIEDHLISQIPETVFHIAKLRVEDEIDSLERQKYPR